MTGLTLVPVPPTENPEWGFWGTVTRSGLDAPSCWYGASVLIAEATGAPPEAVRAFLDSRHGRHFADDVVGGITRLGPDSDGEVLAEVIDKWQAWTISAECQRKHGMPKGLAYLTGWVLHEGMLAEAEEIGD